MGNVDADQPLVRPKKFGFLVEAWPGGLATSFGRHGSLDAENAFAEGAEHATPRHHLGPE